MTIESVYMSIRIVVIQCIDMSNVVVPNVMRTIRRVRHTKGRRVVDNRTVVWWKFAGLWVGAIQLSVV